MSAEKSIKIVANDFYGDNCLKDNFAKDGSADRRPEGWVEIYEVDEDGTEILKQKSNLVVYQGREVIAQRMFNINSSANGTKDEYITWFGIGSGGVNVGDPFNPTPPVATDTDLSIPIPISNIDPTCADLNGGFYYKKPIESFSFEQDTYNDDAWLIVKTVSRVALADCDNAHISEAGLYTSEGGPIANYGGPFHIFSKVTFPTVVKTNTSQLLFIWYIYF